MSRRALLIGAPLAAGLMLWGGGAQALAEYRVRSGLQEAGIGDRTSGCMARRMVERLTYYQLYKLQAYEGEKRSLGDYVKAVRRVGDGEVVTVTVSSAALCASGLAR